MTALKRALSWFGRRSILFVALAAGMIAYAVWTSGDIAQVELRKPVFHRSQATRLERLVTELATERDKAEKELASAGATAQRSSVAVIENELSASRQERAKLRAAERGGARALLSALTLDLDTILEDRKRDLRLAFIERKIIGLERALAAARDHDRLVQAANQSAAARADVLNKLIKTKDSQAKQAKKFIKMPLVTVKMPRLKLRISTGTGGCGGSGRVFAASVSVSCLKRETGAIALKPVKENSEARERKPASRKDSALQLEVPLSERKHGSTMIFRSPSTIFANVPSRNVRMQAAPSQQKPNGSGTDMVLKTY